RQHDHLLNRTLAKTLFSFPTNKAIFNGLARISARPSYRYLLRRVGETSRLRLTTTELAAYHGESATRIASILTNLDKSEVLGEDPIGRSALANAVRVRSDIRAQFRVEVRQSMASMFVRARRRTGSDPSQAPSVVDEAMRSWRRVRRTGE